MRTIREHDFYTLDTWREERGVPLVPRDLYPPDGLIVEGVAAGFLTLTTSKMALVENVVTNPRALKEDREKAVIEIVKKLEELAVSKGCKYLVGITQNSKVEQYCEWLGAKPVKAKMFGKEL